MRVTCTVCTYRFSAGHEYLALGLYLQRIFVFFFVENGETDQKTTAKDTRTGAVLCAGGAWLLSFFSFGHAGMGLGWGGALLF